LKRNKKNKNRIKFLAVNPKTDWWSEISDKEKASIERGIEDANHGRVIPHETVKKLYVKWLY